MAEFSIIEQQMMTKGLTDQQRMMFNSQYESSKKDRNTVLILSVLFGTLGVDRFMIGDMGMGLLKLFTGGCCGILWLIDIFTIRGKVDDYNRNKATEVLQGIKIFSNEDPSTEPPTSIVVEKTAVAEVVAISSDKQEPKVVSQPVFVEEKMETISPPAPQQYSTPDNTFHTSPPKNKNIVFIVGGALAAAVIVLLVTVSTKSSNSPATQQAPAVQAPAPVAPAQSSDAMSQKAQDLFDQATVALGNREYDRALTLLQVADGMEPSNPKILNAINVVKNAQANAVKSMQIK